MRDKNTCDVKVKNRLQRCKLPSFPFFIITRNLPLVLEVYCACTVWAWNESWCVRTMLDNRTSKSKYWESFFLTIDHPNVSVNDDYAKVNGTAFPFVGGEDAALARVQSYVWDTKNVLQYKVSSCLSCSQDTSWINTPSLSETSTRSDTSELVWRGTWIRILLRAYLQCFCEEM